MAGEHAYYDEDKIFASVMGLANYVGKNVFVVAIKTCYMPLVGDLVIGKVEGIRFSGWIVNIKAPYSALLFASDVFDRPYDARKEELSEIFDIGDMILGKILAFDRTRDPIMTVRESGLGKITQGRIVKMTPTKIPRLIGRKGSMITMLKSVTDCQITIGRNGLILVKGKNHELEDIVILAINTIEENAHTSGLTDMISNLLKEKKEALHYEEN